MTATVRLEGPVRRQAACGSGGKSPKTSTPFLAWILTLAFAVPSMAATTSPTPDKPSAHCTGRFDFTLPPALKPTGRSELIYLLQVRTEPWAPGEDAPQAWSRRLARARASAIPTPVLLREFEIDGVGPAAWLQPAARSPQDVTLVAMRALANHAYSLFLEVEASKGREAVGERVVTEVAKSYVPNSVQGFCVGPGAFVIRPSKNERALGTFASASVEVTVQTETVERPDDGQNTTGELPPGSRLLLKEPRRLAGFDGIEQRVEIVEQDGTPHLTYLWIFPGRPVDGSAPRIRLRASAAAARHADLDLAWGSLLAGWRTRPLGVR